MTLLAIGDPRQQHVFVAAPGLNIALAGSLRMVGVGPLVAMARQMSARRVARLGQRKPGTDLAPNDFPQKIACGQALAHAIFSQNFPQAGGPIVRLRSEGTAD